MKNKQKKKKNCSFGGFVTIISWVMQHNSLSILVNTVRL